MPIPSTTKRTLFASTTATPARTPSRVPAKIAAMESQTAPAVRKPASTMVRAPIAKSPAMTLHARARKEGRREK